MAAEETPPPSAFCEATYGLPRASKAPAEYKTCRNRNFFLRSGSQAARLTARYA